MADVTSPLNKDELLRRAAAAARQMPVPQIGGQRPGMPQGPPPEPFDVVHNVNIMTAPGGDKFAMLTSIHSHGINYLWFNAQMLPGFIAMMQQVAAEIGAVPGEEQERKSGLVIPGQG